MVMTHQDWRYAHTMLSGLYTDLALDELRDLRGYLLQS
jgi:hypothetical protein